jgi:hypothetical protein
MKINVKKTLIVVVIVFLAGYVIYDVSLKVISGFRLQGYQIAVQELVKQAENEECYPFEIFTGEKRINLINIDCLQSQEGDVLTGEEMYFDEEPMVE